MSIVRTDRNQRSDQRVGNQHIGPDGHWRRPRKRLTRKGKACALCDAGHHADGPRGHHVDGKWIACGNQAQPQTRKAPNAASKLHYDRAAKGRGRKRKPPAAPAALVPAAFVPEQRLLRPA